jgi:Ca2+:H+ antiporter
VIGSLLNATFGNATELIVALVALFNGNFLVVKTSLLGSVLSNVLLVLGMSFALGGVRNTEQLFHVRAHFYSRLILFYYSNHSLTTQASGAQNSGHLLLIASFAIILPVVFLQDQNTDVANDATGNMTHELRVSRGTSVILLITYISFLVFQVRVVACVFNQCCEIVCFL